MAGIDPEEALRANIIHREDHERNFRRLSGLYGQVARVQNRLILEHCLGKDLLDVGAGYGNLTRAALDAGLDCTGIEIDEEKIRRAKEWFHVDLQARDIHHSAYADGAFDTVIFREVLRHLRLEEAMAEAARLARRRIVVFQANPLWILKAAKLLVGHREHVEYTPRDIVAAMERLGLACQNMRYSDPLAFPLSGGYIGRQLLPRWNWLYRVVLALDRGLERLLTFLGLGRFGCFRMLIVADKRQGDADVEPRAE